VLAESLVRLGRPFLEGNVPPGTVITMVTDAGNDLARNFFRRIFLVEVARGEGGVQVHAHPHASWGRTMTSARNKEVFEPNLELCRAAPFTLPKGGNPRVPQGCYPVPVYLVYDKDFAVFGEDQEALGKFLRARLQKTIDLVGALVEPLSRSFAAYQVEGKEKCLGLIILADVTDPDGPYRLAPRAGEDQVALCESAIHPGSLLVADLGVLLKRVWPAKFLEGGEMGRLPSAECSLCHNEAEVVSVYTKAWPWFSVTWTGPLPLPLSNDQLVEGLALCWLNKEIFSPCTSVYGKEIARRGTPQPIHGGVLVLPVLDQFLADDEERDHFASGLLQMQADPRSGRPLASITGFEFSLPEKLDDDAYRLTMLYYSGDASRGDIHLRTTMEDVIPSLAGELCEVIDELVSEAGELHEQWAARSRAGISDNLRYRYGSLPFLLGNAYGPGYVWQALSDALHRRPLAVEPFVHNTCLRMQELSHRLPDSLWQLREEVRFYVVFMSFLRKYSRISGQANFGGVTMRDWRELQGYLVHTDIGDLAFDGVDELGFACGQLTRQFSKQYWRHTEQHGGSKDFLKHRVMTFGSSLGPDDVFRKALSKFQDYALKLGMPVRRQFFHRAGVLLTEYARLAENIRRQSDEFMAAFWAGYALQDLAPKESIEEDEVLS